MAAKPLNRMLSGENARPHYTADARALIGRQVEFLRTRDIDRSGRGYFFPRTGRVEDVYRRHLSIGGDWVAFAELVELRVVNV